MRDRILESLNNFRQFGRTLHRMLNKFDEREVGKLIFEATKNAESARQAISDYYYQALSELETPASDLPRSTLKQIVHTLHNLGLGELVFVSPEGTHAAAGGMAQVVVGLTESLSRHGIPTTVITLLYEHELGNKHRSADETINQGVRIFGEQTPLEEVGTVEVPFGPTIRFGCNETIKPAQVITARVYVAENSGVRYVMLRHGAVAPTLYSSWETYPQLQQAIFLSRGAIEVIRNKRFGINPQILVSNDWLTGLVPTYLKTDPLYTKDNTLRLIETVHILHNCGSSYQGRFATVQHGEDFWPMLGLSGEHYFGLADPADERNLNFTAAAIVHVTKALLAVSRPYAQELLTEEGGEGLHELFRRRQDVLFGISNGVDLQSLRKTFLDLGKKQRVAFASNSLSDRKNQDMLRKLCRYKRITKRAVQKKYGFTVDAEALLLSFVGRIAEQKGISLFIEPLPVEKVTVLESILRLHPNVQILLGGPPSDSPQMISRLRDVSLLLEKKFPGRFKTVLEYIPHQEVLQITGASDIFLMPSRYEPGGISQLEALAAGTMVVARNVGGIRATLTDYSESSDSGNAFLFLEYTTTAFRDTISRGIQVCSNEEIRQKLVFQAALAEHDWDHRLPKYVAMFQHIAGVLNENNSYPHIEPKAQTLKSIRP